jgi:microcystin degradation protein MlrC
MSFYNGSVGAGLNEKFYAPVQPKPQAEAEAAARSQQPQAAVKTDQKFSGVAWSKEGENEPAISTREEVDSLVLSNGVSFAAADKREAGPAIVRAASSVREALNNFRQSLVAKLYDSIETAMIKEYSADAIQAKTGRVWRDACVGVLGRLGENPAGKMAEIRGRVETKLRQENPEKLGHCILTGVKMEIYG